MFGNMNMQELGKMLEGMQEQTQKMEEELASKELTVKTGGGLLKVVMSGKGEMIDIDIDDSLMEDKESLQILLIAAINDANKMAADLSNPNLQDGEYPYNLNGSGIAFRNIGILLGSCVSPFVNPKGRQLLDCEYLKEQLP